LEKRLLSEQSDAAFDRRYGTAAAAAKTNAQNRAMINSVVDWYKQNSHEVNQVLQIGTAFIPVIGPFVSAGIGLVDASMYSNEGRKGEAGVTAFFAMLPAIGSVVSKIPGVKQLGQKGMQSLASKLLTKAPLNAVEQGVVSGINLNKALVKQETNNVIKSMASKAVAKVRDKATQKVMMNLAKDGIEAKAEDVAMGVVAAKPTYTGAIKSGTAGTIKPGGTTQRT
jgi:hypothetical protein